MTKKQRIEALERKVAALEKRIDELEKRPPIIIEKSNEPIIWRTPGTVPMWTGPGWWSITPPPVVNEPYKVTVGGTNIP